MRSIRRAAAVALLAAVTGGCAEPPAPERVLRPVRYQTVYNSGAARERSFSGTARAGRETDLSFRVAGRIDRLAVRVGDAVRAGQLIASLDPEDFEIAVRRAEAALRQAQANSRNAAADLQRVRGLYESQNASQTELDAALAASQSANAQTDSARESLEQARRQLEYARLTAPMDGAIASVDVEVNENVGQGQTVVMMTSGSRSEVEVAIPEVLIAQIRQGDAVTVTFDALPGGSFGATVTEVGVAATGATTTFPVIVRLDRSTRDVRPGMAASVTFRFESTDARERILLPTQAVGEDRQGRFVFLLEPDGDGSEGFARRTEVEVGDLTPSGLEILSGLEEGQQVITAGVRRLSDGQRVRILEEWGSR